MAKPLPDEARKCLRRLLLPLATPLLLILGACDQGPATNTRYMHPTGARDFLIAATKNQGALYLEVSGEAFTPWPAADASLGAIIEKAVQWRVLSVTSDKAQAEDGRFKILLAFNAPETTKVFALCEQAPSGGPARADGRVEVLAAFCSETTLISAVHGWVEEAENPDSERFRQLVRQTARDLFRAQQRDE